MNEPLKYLHEVTNRSGLHMRPLQAFVEAASRFKSAVQVGRVGSEEMVNGKSMIHLLGLGADKGSVIRVEVSGDDAAAALEELKAVLERVYDDN